MHRDDGGGGGEHDTLVGPFTNKIVTNKQRLWSSQVDDPGGITRYKVFISSATTHLTGLGTNVTPTVQIFGETITDTSVATPIADVVVADSAVGGRLRTAPPAQPFNYPALHLPSPSPAPPLHLPSPSPAQPFTYPALHLPSPSAVQPFTYPALHLPSPSPRTHRDTTALKPR
ncbi:unnamed protein product [Lampetra fluviatilis]